MICILIYIHFCWSSTIEYIDCSVPDTKFSYYSCITAPQDVSDFVQNYEFFPNIEFNQTSHDVINTEITQQSFALGNKIRNSLDKMQVAISECKTKTRQFIIEMKKKSILKENRKLDSQKNIKNNKDIEKYNVDLRMIKTKNLYKLTYIQMPIIKKKLKALSLPLDVQNIIYNFVDLFESFISVYDIKNKLHKDYSNIQRIKVHENNIEIFSLFYYIPILETLEILRYELKSYNFENMIIHNKVIVLLNLIKKKLLNLSLLSDKAIKIYEKLNEIYKNA
ncbi:putative SP-containing protein [Vairimorpha necatrix]|uniref:SP-containing protein n=1 Tax=Vairimorpha necatrix TaxID=6039 RepID=A0AAX4JAE6_9MICR